MAKAKRTKTTGYGKGFATLKVLNPELHHHLSVVGGRNNTAPRSFVSDPSLAKRASALGCIARWGKHPKD